MQKTHWASPLSGRPICSVRRDFPNRVTTDQIENVTCRTCIKWAARQGVHSEKHTSPK